MIFTDYWKVLVLNFSVMGNTVFFSAKKLMERWYLRGLFELSMIFQDLRNMVFRAVQLFFAEHRRSLIWQISSVKWLLKTGAVGLGTFASKKDVGLFFVSSTIKHLELNCIPFNFINSVVTCWGTVIIRKKNIFSIWTCWYVYTTIFLLDILCYGVHKVITNYPLC